MITGYEEPVLFPSMNLYDTRMMQMYINAAKEQYNQNREDMANFLKEYGSFTSPISSDVTWVDQQTRGRINDAINYLQQNGIDPLRSAEGRAVIQRVINSTDVAGINARKQSAENRKLWDKTAAALKAEGKYNADFVNWAFQQKYGVDPSQWSTASNGIWQETSPEIYQDLNAATKAWYDQMQPGYLGTVDGYDYVGNTPEDVAAIAKQNLPDLTSTYWQYQKELARRQLGPNATEDQINGQLVNNIVAAQAEKYMRPKRIENAEYERSRNFYWGNKLDEEKSKRDLENKIAYGNAQTENKIRLKSMDGSVDSSDSSSSSGTGGGKESFSESQYQLARGVTNIMKNTTIGRSANVATYRDFDPEWIDGMLPMAQEEIANKFYTEDISGGTNSTYNVKRNSEDSFVYDPQKNKMVSNPNAYTASFDLANYTSNGTISMLPAVTKEQKEKLKVANRNFIDRLSVDYSPAAFAKWTNKSTKTGDNLMILISNDDDAKNRLYSIDEIALRSAGVNRPVEDFEWAKTTTDSSRKSVEKAKNVYMKSTGKITTSLGTDGAIHIYQIVNIYEGASAKPNGAVQKMKSIGQMAYDMGIKTYDNPNFGIGDNVSTNLYLDETNDAHTRWTGDQSVLHWEHVKTPEINSTIAYPVLP